MDTKHNIEHKMVSEFISKTGANPNDALICLKTWGWDMKRAITDYNDTCAIDFIEDDDENSKDTIVMNHSSSTPFYKQDNSKPISVLTKQDSMDVTDCKKLYRGISRATDNVGIVSRARYEIAKDIYKSMRKNAENELSSSSTVVTPQPAAAAAAAATTITTLITNNYQYSVDKPDSTFILPNIYNYPDDFRIFIEKDLIEMSTLNALEQAQRLNWWADTNACRKLWPLATTGDGNCLLHAASLGMWGFHDRKLTLRTALYSVLSDGKFKDALHRRWRFQQTQLNKRAGFVYSENEWAKEWDDIIAMASPEPRKSMNNHQQQQKQQQYHQNSSNDDYNKRKLTFLDRNSLTESEILDNNSSSGNTAAIYESLEEIHILALAHVLRRTIIVISDTVLKDLHGEAMAPITFGGIYLPFEIEPKECNRGPLLLAYDMAHFSALVPMENDNDDYPPFLVPLTDYENILLPIQFCIDPGEDFDWKSYNGNEDNWALTEREHIALLKEYLDIVYVTTNHNSPEDEICEDIEDEFEKKFLESEIVIPTAADYIPNISEETNNGGKSKASRQLHSVAKQFGSIGKNMSRKLKKNIGSIAKLGGKNFQKKNSLIMCGGTSPCGGGGGSNGTPSGSQQSYITCSRILCARLRVKRHDYQEEMIRNYIECAQNRFLEIEKQKEQKMTSTITGNGTGSSTSSTIIPVSSVTGATTIVSLIPKDDIDGNDINICSDNCNKLETLSINENHHYDNLILHQQPNPASSELSTNNYQHRSICINAGCTQYATSDTSYLCPECFEKQKKHENSQFFNSSPRYGTGNSKFYTQADIHSHDSIRKLPSLRKLNDLDQTLYLSNSTFYNDVLPSYSEVERANKESQLYSTSASHQISSPSSSSSSSHSPLSSQTIYGSSMTKQPLNGGKESTYTSPPLSSSSSSSITIRTDVGNNRIDPAEHHHHHHHHHQHDNDDPPIQITRPCKTLGCPYYGNSSTNFLCSQCQKSVTPITTAITTTTSRNNNNNINNNNNLQQELKDYHHATFQQNPLYASPTSVALYKSESKITSDI